jgi:hypothetical protein
LDAGNTGDQLREDIPGIGFLHGGDGLRSSMALAWVSAW